MPYDTGMHSNLCAHVGCVCACKRQREIKFLCPFIEGSKYIMFYITDSKNVLCTKIQASERQQFSCALLATTSSVLRVVCIVHQVSEKNLTLPSPRQQRLYPLSSLCISCTQYDC